MARSDQKEEAPPSTSALVLAIHAAGANEEDWPAVLEQMRHCLDARVVTLGRHEFISGCDSALFEAPREADFSRDLALFAARNPWYLSSDDYRPGRVMTGDELISPSDLRRTDFYRGFLQPRGLLHLLCGVVDQRHRGVHLVTAYRSETQAPFSEREKAELAGLLEHITLSMQSHWRWQEASDMARALLALSDHDLHPTLLVTGDGQTLYCNQAAAHLLDRSQGLCLEGPRLVAASVADRRLLGDTIARLAREDAASGPPAPAVLTMASGPGLPAVVVVLRALGQVFRQQDGATRGLVMVAVRGGHAGHDPAQCAFARQYELTAAQAKVSALVFAGQSLATIAQSLNLSENTVRSHLKQIFQKTDTHGQMELVHLHARVCTNLP